MKRSNYIYYLVVLSTIAPISNVNAQALQTQDWVDWNVTSPPSFPTKTWMQYESPEEAGWSSEKLSSVREMSERARSAAVIVIYNGAILAQWGETRRRFPIYSVAKSMLSALYGIAVGKGDIELDETIGSIGIDDVTPLTETEKTAKVSDLLKAQSGVYLPAAGESDRMKRSRLERGSHKPGTQWSYNGWDFDALGTIYNLKTSGDMLEAIEKHLAIPLQLQDFELRHASYHSQPEKFRHSWYPMRMSARDLARFGLLYLNKGRWKEQQIVPSEWVLESTESHSTHSGGGYGYLWWTYPKRSRLGKLGTYAAAGKGGHGIYVVPGANLVFVHRVNNYDDWTVIMDSAIENILIAVLQARSGPPSLEPKLIPASNPKTDTPRKTLSGEQLSALTGKYTYENYTVSIREFDGRLEYTNSYSESFYLFPKTATKFEIEDIQWRIEFSLDTTGSATALQIWVNPDESYVLHRIP